MTNGSNQGTDAAARQALANAEKAEADARSARIVADKAAREEAESNTDLVKRQREAEARQKTAEADKAARDAAVSLDPALERQKQEAEARKAIYDADRSVAQARQAQLAALLPDLSKVEPTETKISGDRPLYGAALAHRALASAVDTLVGEITKHLPASGVVLLTDDPDLATSDAVFTEVTTALTQFIAVADALLVERELDGLEGASLDPLSLGAVVAGALPPIISMFSARRTVSSYASTVDTAAVMALVAGALARSGRSVRMDDFRLLPRSYVVDLERQLRERRGLLASKKIERDLARSQADADRTRTEERIDELNKLLDKSSTETAAEDRTRWEQARESAKADRDRARAAVTEASVRTSAIDPLLVAIDALLQSLHTIPTGAKRSPVVMAALREQLHSSPGQSRQAEFPVVLYLKAAAGSTDQLVSDKPLWADDKFHVVATVSVSYWLMDTSSSDIVCAGVAGGSAELKLRIGDSFTVTSSDQ